MRTRRLRTLAGAAIALAALSGIAEPAAAGWKVAHWNVMSGFGKGGWSGSCPFKPGSDCSRNAWGSGVMKRILIEKVKNDPAVVALTLNEAWTCATPRRIQALLGWAGVAPNHTTAGEVGGVSIVARYGFAGPAEVKALPKCSSSSGQYYIVRAPVYTDAARTRVAQVYATHWKGCAIEAAATVAFMQKQAYKPRSLTGDLNVKDPASAAIRTLLGMNYRDAWRVLSGTAAGHTATWNREYGDPPGNLYKRIDYAFFKTLTPVSIVRFNHNGPAGTCKPSDHAGLIVEYRD
ncbi:MAG TPA: endonuclease/exonuclease/phosphatase family protein [Thermodesulfobacteriota bacterium]|nr:endonuclease/exonuclease/phosphatase family protein [Thermodesulfobacteriota bacterium]